VIRRILLAGGALAAAASLSSCTTFSRGDAAAEANGEQLTRSELNALTGGETNGDTVRTSITNWLSVAVLGGDVSDITGPLDLAQRRADAINELSAPFMDDARAAYEQGLDGSPLLCLGAIPVGSEADAQTAIAELEGGASLADTASKYSTDATLAGSGGLVVDQNGENCLDPVGFNPDLLTLLAEAGAAPGTPVLVDLGSGPVVVLMRPFDTLTINEKASLVLDQVGADVRERLSGTDIYVNPRFGRWDPDSVSVVPLGNG
jgi:hypothetical protein